MRRMSCDRPKTICWPLKKPGEWISRLPKLTFSLAKPLRPDLAPRRWPLLARLPVCDMMKLHDEMLSCDRQREQPRAPSVRLNSCGPHLSVKLERVSLPKEISVRLASSSVNNGSKLPACATNFKQYALKATTRASSWRELKVNDRQKWREKKVNNGNSKTAKQWQL